MIELSCGNSGEQVDIANRMPMPFSLLRTALG